MSVAVVFAVSVDADDLDFLHFLEDAALDTTGRDGAAAFNVEHVFHRHEERLIDRALRHGDVIIDRRDERDDLGFLLGVAVQRLERAAFDDRNLVAREFVLREQIAHFHFDEVEQFGIVDHVDLVQENDDRRHADLAREQDVLAGLRHRAVGGADDEDRAVHLRGAGDHVLHIVGVAGAIDVRVVALVALVFDVGGIDRDAALFFFGSGVDRIVGARLGHAFLREHAGDRGGEGGLAVVNVTDRADVHVRLVAFELVLSHLEFSLGYLIFLLLSFR